MCLLHALIFFFFFSSRRRHTRSLCDWSSDVCSSDLAGEQRLPQQVVLLEKLSVDPVQFARRHLDPAERVLRRSEERRVGKSVELCRRLRLKKKKRKKNNIADNDEQK